MTSFLTQENEKMALDISTKDGAGSLLVEFDNVWEGLNKDPGLEVLDGELVGKDGRLVIELKNEI